MGLLAVGVVATLLAWREYEILADAFDAVCDECSELGFRLTDAHEWLADYSEMVDALIAEREALAADLNGTTDECRRLRLENDELRALMGVQGVTQFSGDKQAMSHRLYGRQSDVLARRGRRDRKREYR